MRHEEGKVFGSLLATSFFNATILQAFRMSRRANFPRAHRRSMGLKTAARQDMADVRIRRQIALLAARLMYERTESEYFTAKRKAARTLGLDHRHHPKDLPSNREIRDQVQALANLYEGEKRQDRLKEMRLEALHMMRRLAAFRPKLIGSVLTGHIRQGSDIDIHVFTNNQSAVLFVLDEQNDRYTVEKKRIIKHNVERFFTHIHIEDRFNIELTLYPEDKANYAFNHRQRH